MLQIMLNQVKLCAKKDVGKIKSATNSAPLIAP